MHKLQIIRIRKLENQRFAYLPQKLLQKNFTIKAHEKKYSRGKYRENVHDAISQKRKFQISKS